MRPAKRVRLPGHRHCGGEVMTTVATASVGDRIVLAEEAVTRLDLASYCFASGDRNPIHWSGEAARNAGLPDVIAHGMFTMGLASRALAEWARGEAVLTEMAVRFARPLQVPDSVGGVRLVVTATVRERSDARLILDLEVESEGAALLTAASAVLRRKDGYRHVD
jgi:acyl dehydratase